MAKFVIGRKSGMTQLFDENGNVIPATVIEVEPMYVLQNKTVEALQKLDMPAGVSIELKA